MTVLILISLTKPYLTLKEITIIKVIIIILNEDMILALAGQFKQLSHEPENHCLNCPASARIISSFDFKHHTSDNISFIIIIFIHEKISPC